jgi:hypothetical protein
MPRARLVPTPHLFRICAIAAPSEAIVISRKHPTVPAKNISNII